VPRGFDPAVNEIDGVYLYDVDDLEGVIADNKGARAEEATLAETIVDAEVGTFCQWLDGLDVVPTVVALREACEHIRDHELARWTAAAGAALDPAQREGVDRLTRAIVNKILHRPLTELRRRGAEGDDPHLLDLVRGLFRLGGDDPDPDEDG
jgi:glutamyl-tRNA reductase